MERHDRDKYYHSGHGSENRRDWDRSSRDGDFGRDYENRFRTDRDRNDEYRRRNREMNDNYYSNTQGDENDDLSNIRHSYGISSFGNESRFTDTGEDIAQRMRRDRERLHDQGYGSGRTSGYSGSAFGGSNYSAHGDFSGSSDYGSMSGGDGNVDDYVSMSGYGGGRSNFAARSERGVPDESRRNYGNERSGSGMGRSDFERNRNVGRYSPDNQSSMYTSFSDIRHKESGNYRTDRIKDRGGYDDYDPNNRW